MKPISHRLVTIQAVVTCEGFQAQKMKFKYWSILCVLGSLFRAQDTAINKAQSKYQAWLTKNVASDIEIHDVSASTTHPVGTGYDPFFSHVITVKYYGRAQF